MLIAYALQGRGLADSLATGFVSYLAAAVVVLAMLLWPGNFRHASSLDPTAMRWFALSGVIVFFSALFRHMALAAAPVSIVTPVQRRSIVFRLLFTTLPNRESQNSRPADVDRHTRLGRRRRGAVAQHGLRHRDCATAGLGRTARAPDLALSDGEARAVLARREHAPPQGHWQKLGRGPQGACSCPTSFRASQHP